MARKIVVSLVADPDAPSFFNRQLLAQNDATDLARELIGDSATEAFLVIVLNNKNQVIDKNKIIAHKIVATGGRNACIVDPVVIFHSIISQMGSAFICVHNHPSGDPIPSKEDDVITRRLMMGADIFGLRFLDHIILGEEKTTYSYAETGFQRALDIMLLKA